MRVARDKRVDAGHSRQGNEVLVTRDRPRPAQPARRDPRASRSPAEKVDVYVDLNFADVALELLAPGDLAQLAQQQRTRHKLEGAGAKLEQEPRARALRCDQRRNENVRVKNRPWHASRWRIAWISETASSTAASSPRSLRAHTRSTTSKPRYSRNASSTISELRASLRAARTRAALRHLAQVDGDFLLLRRTHSST